MPLVKYVRARIFEQFLYTGALKDNTHVCSCCVWNRL